MIDGALYPPDNYFALGPAGKIKPVIRIVFVMVYIGIYVG